MSVNSINDLKKHNLFRQFFSIYQKGTATEKRSFFSKAGDAIDAFRQPSSSLIYVQKQGKNISVKRLIKCARQINECEDFENYPWL